MTVIHVYSVALQAATGPGGVWVGSLVVSFPVGNEEKVREFSGTVETVKSQPTFDLLALAETLGQVQGAGHDLVLHTQDWNVLALLDPGIRQRTVARRFPTEANAILRAVQAHTPRVSHLRDHGTRVELARLREKAARLLGAAAPAPTKAPFALG